MDDKSQFQHRLAVMEDKIMNLNEDKLDLQVR